MQWNLITSANLPAPGQSVLGLWADGYWQKVSYALDTGWYTSLNGCLDSPPVWWGEVDSARPPRSAVAVVAAGPGTVGAGGRLGISGPDAHILERVRKFLESLIAVRDCTANGTMLAEIVGAYECYDDWAADNAVPLLQMLSLMPVPPATIAGPPLALDVSLEQARALHRVWRALNDGDCPNCHKFHAATEIHRTPDAITCPSCWFHVKKTEIATIEKLFAPAMNAAVAIFNKWRDENNNKPEKTDEVDRDK